MHGAFQLQDEANVFGYCLVLCLDYSLLLLDDDLLLFDTVSKDFNEEVTCRTVVVPLGVTFPHIVFFRF